MYQSYDALNNFAHSIRNSAVLPNCILLITDGFEISGQAKKELAFKNRSYVHSITLVPVKLIPIRPAGDHLPLWTHWVAVLEPEAAQRDDDELDGIKVGLKNGY